MKIIQVNPSQRRHVQQFIDLPFRLYKDVPQWVPPIRAEANFIFNTRKNPYYQHSTAAFFLAMDDRGQALGRLAVLNNHNYNAYNHCRKAFFYLFECENDLDLAASLFEAGFDWARQQGLNHITGPRGFTVLDGYGMLVKGFEHRPAFGLPYNFDYYPRLLESVGFETEGESLSGYLNANIVFPEKIAKIADLLKERRGLQVAQLRSRREVQQMVLKLKDLYNAALGGTEGNVPLTDAEVKSLANQMLWFADPRLIKIVMKGDQPVGFLLAYPDLSAALQRCRGRLFPLGWFWLWLELHRTPWININGAGMSEGYRGLGGTAVLFTEMFKSVTESRYRYADVVQIGTENDRMLRELRNLGIDFYKKHRIYRRDL